MEAMTSIDELLSRKPDPATEDVEVVIGGELVTFRFTEMPGEDWAEATTRNPVRIASPIDRNYGYNLHGTCVMVAPLCGVQVVDDVEVKLSEKQWPAVFKALNGHDFNMICSAIWGLNEYNPSQRVVALKKGSAGRPVSKRK